MAGPSQVELLQAHGAGSIFGPSTAMLD